MMKIMIKDIICMLIDEKNLFYVVKNAKIFVILNFFAEIFNFF